MTRFYSSAARSGYGRSMLLWISSLLLVSLIVPVLSPVDLVSAETEPGVGTYFKYKYEQDISKCRGAYSGYNEETEGKGTYRVTEWNQTVAKVKYSWWWDYWSSTEPDDYGERRGTVSFDRATFRYTSDHFDLDDPVYRGIPTTDMYVWFCIPTGVEKGDKLDILDSEWTVTNTDKTLWSKGIPRKVIEVEYEGRANRNDDYGRFSYHFIDRLYFEKRTGFFFAERYDEWDHGTWEGDSASFKITIKLDVYESSYSVEIDWFTMIVVYSLIILGSLSIIYLFYIFIKWARWKKRYRVVTNVREMSTIGGPVDTVYIYRIRKMKGFPHFRNLATYHFEPFLEYWTRKSLSVGDRVVAASTKDHNLVGFALYNKEAKIGTILCRNSELTEMIRRFIGCKDFFTEDKHIVRIKEGFSSYPITSSIPNNYKEKDIYNIFETHTVYQLNGIPKCTYDTDLVRPMREADLPVIMKLAKEIYRTPSKKWIGASFRSGDIAFVAEMDGKIVGFAFAEVCGEYGRVHTLSVVKEYRGRGIAKELFNARLEAMRQMGVAVVVDEIADWNLASIRIATVAGFKPISKMYVETARTKRIKKDIIRR
ncbi:MAG: N-acetyltransferase family protein [Thermoplasmatota archaeon]